MAGGVASGEPRLWMCMSLADGATGWKTLGYASLVIIPSLDTILKYFGPMGVLVYFFAGSILLAATARYFAPFVALKINERTANFLAAAVFGVIIVLVLAIYPIANTSVPNAGSDSDDALIVTTANILKGEYPYYARTYLGNPAGPMPGSIILAFPFTIAGLIHFQNIFWLAIFFFLARTILGTSILALTLLCVLLVFCPTLWQNLVTACDYTSNSIFVPLFMYLLVRSASSLEARRWQAIISSILLGVALSTRSNFFLLMPVLFSALVQLAGWRSAVKYMFVTAVTFLAVTLPFFLYDPPEFSPFVIQSKKMQELEGIIPFVGVLVPGLSLLLSVIFSFRTYSRDGRSLFLSSAIVQVFILLFISSLYTVKLGRLDLFVGQTGYGMFTLFFAALAWWMTIYSPNNRLARHLNA